MARTTRASLAKATAAADGMQQLSSPPAAPAPTTTSKRKSTTTAAKSTTPAKGSRKKEKAIKRENGDVNELPHNLATIPPTPSADKENDDAAAEPPKKRARRGAKQEQEAVKEEADVKAEDIKDEDASPKPTPKKTPKKDNYGLTPGVTPYPDFPHPTPEECKEVVRLLEKVHGKVVAPKAIPPPSLDVSGCGEVPSVLDALVRTRLSANTTNKNSSTAFQGLVARFGTLKEGIGKGSVDWDAVRRASQKDVFKAIERGGLADRKSKDIQAILQIAHDETQERKASGEDKAATAKAEQNVISFDHIHELSTDDAINKMLTLPGIGPKTASCVALFCLQRPSFAVDTHVFRLCQYLHWVPKSTKKGQPKVDRNTTYSHCDVRIPDEFKYPLHALLIKHGKTCPRCRAATGTSSEAWADGCPIDHLVQRGGGKKGGASAADRKKAKEAAGGENMVEGEVDDARESELSDAPEDED